jgi:hypothetical protein
MEIIMSNFTKFVYLFFISLFVVSFANAQQLSLSVSQDINMPGQDLMFGNDVMIVNNEPEGPVGGIKANDGTIWVVINDTTITAGSGLIFYKSTNAGVNWTQHGTTIQPAFIAGQVKMIKAGDSTYCFFRLGGAVYRFNVGNSSLAQFAPASNIEHFDVTSSSTNSLYIFYSNPTNLMRYGSTDGGFTWGNSGNVSGGSKKPAIFMSATSDSLTLLYRAAGGDSSAITRFGYKETSPGILSSNTPVGAILTAGIKRTDYYPYRIGSSVWVVYTEESASGINLKCLTSTNRGTNFSAPLDISANAGNDNFWFAGGISPNGAFLGIDLFWLRDSTGTANDKLMYVGCESSDPTAFGTPTSISQNPPVSSTRGYKPCAIELGLADVGVVFVAENSGTRRVYWDRYDALTNIVNNNVVADNYSLSQNYPNPFNPSTKISFSIPQSDNVILKVYDMMGKEVATLVNTQMNMGSYSVDFNATNLSSGVYFYKLVSGNFTEVKKMTLIK